MKSHMGPRDERGAAAIEFALLSMLLFLLLFGIVEFGLLFYNKHVITNASREGARFGIVSQTPRKTEAEIRAVVLNYSQNHLVTFDESRPDPVVTIPTGVPLLFGQDLKVRVTYNYEFLILPDLGMIGLPNPFPLSAETLMKME